MLGRNSLYVVLFASLVWALVAPAAGSGSKRVAAPSAEKVTPMKLGDVVPFTKVTTEGGESVKFSRSLGDTPTVIVFYRGHWCPYCMKHLKSLQEISGELAELGVKLVAVSPDKPEYITEAKEKAKLTFDIYSDSKLELATAMGVSFELDPDTAKRYKKHLVESTGHDTGQLPVPSVFLADKFGVIKYAFWNPDYKVRLSNEELLAEAKKAVQ